jgi:hypothetical protein
VLKVSKHYSTLEPIEANVYNQGKKFVENIVFANVRLRVSCISNATLIVTLSLVHQSSV